MSTLSTITFDTLRERNEQALDRVNYAPDVDISTLTAYQRRRVQQLLGDRTDLEDLASTQDQRESYGIEQWHNQFVRLRDLPQHPDSTLEGDRLRQHIWDAMPNSRFKRFQEAFSYPHQFIVPAFNIGERNSVTFVGHQNFNTMSLEPCLVSADRISEKLAVDLELVEFDENDERRPYQRLQKKAQPEAIARLKKTWESAVPLQQGHHRILTIQPSSAAVNDRYPDTEGPSNATVGTILYTREEENGRQQAQEQNDRPRQLTVQHFPSAYAAHRKTFHENHAYRREIDQLSQLQDDLRALNGRLDRDWKRDTSETEKGEMRTEAQESITQCRELLSACENKYKVQAHDLLEHINDLQDSSNKTNVGASLAKMVAVINRLQSRFEEMYPKGGFNEQDQMVLEAQIQNHERGIRRYRDNVQRNADVVHDGLQLFNGNGLSPDQVDSQSRGVLRRMHIHPDDLKGIRLRPFTTYAGRLREKHDALDDALHERSLDASQDAVVQMHVIGKFQAMHTCFEHVKRYIIDGEHLPISRIRDFVHHLRELFSTYQVLPDHIVAGYEGTFQHMRDELERIEQGLEHYAKQDVDVSERTEIYKRLKAYLEQFDIEEMVMELP